MVTNQFFGVNKNHNSLSTINEEDLLSTLEIRTENFLSQFKEKNVKLKLMENQLGVLTTEKQVLNQKIELLNQQFQHHESMRMHQYSSESIKKNTSITTSLNSTKNCNDNDTNSEEFSKKINSNAKIHTIIIDDVDPMRRSFNNNTNKNNYFEKIGPG